MTHSIERWARRDYGEVSIWDVYGWHITLASAIFFVSSALFFGDMVFHWTSVKAAPMNPEDVQTLEAACSYAGLYPESISNLDDLQVACADNGTPVQFMDPNWNKKV